MKKEKEQKPTKRQREITAENRRDKAVAEAKRNRRDELAPYRKKYRDAEKTADAKMAVAIAEAEAEYYGELSRIAKDYT